MQNKKIKNRVEFGINPKVNINRTIFECNFNRKTSMINGMVTPLASMEILPGDTIKMEPSILMRLSTPIKPTMDNIFMDVFAFFVPNRLALGHTEDDGAGNMTTSTWATFMGENTTDEWIRNGEAANTDVLPLIQIPKDSQNLYSIWDLTDYLGLPINNGQGPDTTNEYINSIEINAYVDICNEWFRNTAFTQKIIKRATKLNTITVPTRSQATDVNAQNQDIALGYNLFRANKYEDIFTTCLPAPQRGPVEEVINTLNAQIRTSQTKYDVAGAPAMSMANTNGIADDGKTHSLGLGTGNEANIQTAATDAPGYTEHLWAPDNLYASIALSINDFRYAFAKQVLNEKNARGGTRYTEIIANQFGVYSNDNTQDRPELLWAEKIPMNIIQVPQTSISDVSSSSPSPQGNLAAYGLTGKACQGFDKSFTEHGTLMIVAVNRIEHTYSEGIERKFSKKTIDDFYNPVYSHLGEVAVLNKEIYYSEDGVYNNDVFGFNEYAYEYRYIPNKNTAAMRTTGRLGGNYTQGDIWTYADKYFAAPTKPILGEEWINEGYQEVDRTLALPFGGSSANSGYPQMIVDMYCKTTMIRPIPAYTIPAQLGHAGSEKN